MSSVTSSTGRLARVPSNFPLSNKVSCFNEGQCFIDNKISELRKTPAPTTVSCQLYIKYRPPKEMKDLREENIKVEEFDLCWTSENSYQDVVKKAKESLRAKENQLHHDSDERRSKWTIRRRTGTCSIWACDKEQSVYATNDERAFIDAVGKLVLKFAHEQPYQQFKLMLHWEYSAYLAVGDATGGRLEELVRDELNAKLVRDEASASRQATPPYLPLPDLNHILSPDMVQALLKNDRKLQEEYRGRPDKADELLRWAKAGAHKLVALCLLARVSLSYLSALHDCGFNNADLPLTETNESQRARLTRIGDTAFNDLCDKANRLCVFEFESESLSNPTFTIDDRVVVPVHYNINRDEIGAGASARVYRVKIHPDHQRWSSVENSVFALKKFRDGNSVRKIFERECKALEKVLEIAHAHILSPLAIWTHDQTPYILFNCAEGNLKDFMAKVSPPSLTKRTILWILGQLRGLADAIDTFHEINGKRGTETVITAYHHDIKPENILLFIDSAEGHYVLKISDFGLANYHIKTRPNEMSHNTVSVSGTPAYQAPDYHIFGKTGRKADMWSLGCVFLELFDWLLRDRHDQSLAFVDERRRERDLVNISTDSFWKLRDTKKKTGAVLKNVVVSRLNALIGIACHGKSNYKESLRDAVSIVQNLLVIDQQSRLIARDLHKSMDDIYDEAERALRHDPELFERTSTRI